MFIERTETRNGGSNGTTICSPISPTAHYQALQKQQKSVNGSMELTQFRKNFRDKQVVILGLARQGMALAQFFTAAGARVIISDIAPAENLARELDDLAGLPVQVELGGHPLSLLDGCDLLCLSGGVPAQLPIVQEALRRSIPLSNDSLLTLQHAPCPVIAITGSSGKTTTTTLVGKMLERSVAEKGGRVHVGGNIGTPLIHRLDQIGVDDLIVLELSSFQLELFDPAIACGSLEALGPDVAAILNVTPNHLDRHQTMAAYANAKINLLRHLKPGSRVVLSADDPVTSVLGTEDKEQDIGAVPQEWQLETLLVDAPSPTADPQSLIFFSRERTLDRGAWLDGDCLVYNGETFCRLETVRLRGEHNVSNLLAAAAISGAAGATIEAMGQVARTFAGVPHRLEEVHSAKGVSWINDSIATAPERAIAGLRTFEPGAQTLILLAGGKDKKLPWQAFADEVINRANYLIGFGDAGSMIVRTVQERAEFRRVSAPGCAVVQRLDEAVQLAAQIASPNTVVLLSPGGTSYDAYKDFEARGEHFRQLVHAVQPKGDKVGEW